MVVSDKKVPSGPVLAGWIEQNEKVCDAHGPYIEIVYRRFTTGCPACRELDLQRQAEQDLIDQQERTRAEQEARQQREIDELWHHAYVPTRFQNRKLSTYNATLPGQKKALEVAQEFVDTFDPASGKSLIFCGGVGAGKTHLACGIVRELVKKRRPCLFLSVIAAVRSVKDTYRRDSEQSEQQAIDALIEPDLLVLDEVGIQFGTDTERMILFEIINGRYESMRPTLVVSNLAMAKLSDYLGDRVIDRMREDGGKVVVFNWESHRSAKS